MTYVYDRFKHLLLVHFRRSLKWVRVMGKEQKSVSTLFKTGVSHHTMVSLPLLETWASKRPIMELTLQFLFFSYELSSPLPCFIHHSQSNSHPKKKRHRRKWIEEKNSLRGGPRWQGSLKGRKLWLQEVMTSQNIKLIAPKRFTAGKHGFETLRL
jgi:hypothetical protein